MPPKPRPIAPGAPVGERLARIETLLESLAERQQEQHEENIARAEAMARETKEHRHRTNNAMQEVTGRLERIDRATEANATTIVDILTVQAPKAADDRKDLRTRIETLEQLVVGARASWRVVGVLVTIIGAAAAFVAGVVTFGAKVAALFGAKL